MHQCKQDDSFDLELGASASGVTGSGSHPGGGHHRKSSRNSSRQNSSRRYSGKILFKENFVDFYLYGFLINFYILSIPL